MPKNPRSRQPGPLDHLPRPLSERERRGHGGRRLLTLVALVLVVGAVAVWSGALAGPAAPAVGDVAGAIATPEPVVGASTTPATADPTDASSATPGPGPGADAELGAAGAVPLPEVDATLPPTGGTTAAVEPDAPDVVDGASHGPDPATLTGYRWPLPHGRLTLPFGPSPWGGWIVDGENFHDGLDLATFCNDRIVAAHDGVVIAAGRHFDDHIGWVGDLKPYYARLDKKHLWSTLPIVVIVDDGNGYRSVYAHFWKIVVKKGDKVTAGKLIGYEGMTGRASGCHLHYGLFSPDETATFATDKDVAKRMKLPAAEIARIDPLRVLPPRPKDPKPSAAP